MQHQVSPSLVRPSLLPEGYAFARDADERPRHDPQERDWLDEHHEEDPADVTQQARWRFLPSIRLIVGAVILGAVLAAGWRYTGVQAWTVQAWSVRQWLPTFAAQSTKTTSEREDQLAQVLKELEALKQTTNQLAASQQQLAASVASLQVAQKEIDHKLSAASAAPRWYADPMLLKVRPSTSVRPTAASSREAPPARARPAANPEAEAAAVARPRTATNPQAQGARAPISLASPER